MLREVIGAFLSQKHRLWEEKVMVNELEKGTGARLAGKQKKEGSKHWRRMEDKDGKAAIA